MYLRKLFIGCVLIFATFIHFKVNAQYLTVTGNGQLTVRADEVCESSPMMLEFLPTYKPNSKSITITNHFLYRNDVGELKRYSQDGVNHITILYDEQGRIINLNDATFHYEDNRIVECSHKDGFRCRFKYDSNGRLESATRGSWTYMFNVDKKGNIIGLYSYYGTRKTSEISMSYDTKGRIVSYLSDYRDYRWNYNKNGQLISRREIGYSFSQGKMGEKTSDQEYKFEYGEDGNPICCIRYKHGDISIIEGGSEYEYSYTYYPDPKETEERRINDSIWRENQKRINDSIQRENKRKLDSIQKENQRKNDSIKLEEQKQERIRQERIIEVLQPCKFLFNSDEAFASCTIKQNDVVEKEVKSLIVKKMQLVYSEIINGKELRKEKYAGKSELIQICDMCIQLKNLRTRQYTSGEKIIVEHIYTYTESILGDFVTGRPALNKAYQKSQQKEYSFFLLSYMNDK